MRQRPEQWEVVCKTCTSGGLMSDAEVEKRLHGHTGRNWPTHCGVSMQLRHPDEAIWKPKAVCTDASCRFASYGSCACSCRGRWHGHNNEYRQFQRVNVKPLPWYRLPIKTFMTFPELTTP